MTTRGNLKVVMTGAASDPPDWQPLIRNKTWREALAKKFRNVDDPLRMVLVRDMWLTGFDAPSLHTMYVDKPMRGHGLMQAIARVNRVFKDKPGGLVVDYLGLAQQTQARIGKPTLKAVAPGRPRSIKEEAVAVMLEKYEICCGLFHGFDRSKWTAGTPQERLGLLPRRAGAHLGARKWQEPLCAVGTRSLASLRARRAPRGRDPYPRRTWRSSKLSSRFGPSARRPRRDPKRIWIMRYARSSPARWHRKG